MRTHTVRALALATLTSAASAAEADASPEGDRWLGLGPGAWDDVHAEVELGGEGSPYAEVAVPQIPGSWATAGRPRPDGLEPQVERARAADLEAWLATLPSPARR